MLDYNEISEFFGGSIFPEELRGNLETISEKLDKLANTKNQSVTQRANVYILRALFGVITGDIAAAELNIDEIAELAREGLDQKSIARSRLYKYFVVAAKLRPPVLRFWSAINNRTLVIREQELQVQKELASSHAAARTLQSFEFVRNVVEELECTFFADLSCFNFYLDNTCMTHPMHPPSNMSKALLHKLQPLLNSLLQSLNNIQNATTKAYINRLLLEASVGFNEPNFDQKVQQLELLYDGSDDWVGMGLCKIVQADKILSPPFTSPIALNLAPIIGGPGWANQHWDDIEPSFTLKHNDLAESYYDEALYLMEIAGAPRGQAAVHLRKGCILHAQALEARSANPTLVEGLLEAATGQLLYAQGLFSRDHGNLLLVECHLLLIDISQGVEGKVATVLEKAGKIGQNALSTGNTGMSNFCGGLMLRFGRRLFAGFRDIERAILCCRSAQLCFRASLNPIAELGAMVAHAMVLSVSDNVATALQKAHEIRATGGPLLPAVRHLNELIEVAGPKSSLIFTRYSVLQDVDRVLRGIYTKAYKPDLKLSWGEQMNALVPSDAVAMLALEFANTMEEETGGMEPEALTNLIKETNLQAQTHPVYDEISSKFSDSNQRSWEALQESNLESWERAWRDFLKSYEDLGHGQDQFLLYFKTVALSQLNDLKESRKLLQSALPKGYAGSGSAGVFDRLKSFSSGPELAFLRDRDKQDAVKAVTLCFFAQDWNQGFKVLETVERKLPGYLSRNNQILLLDDWNLFVYVGAIYENNWMLEEALAWYLDAMSGLERPRTNTFDLDARLGQHGHIESGELFVGLARVCFCLSNRNQIEPEIAVDPSHWSLPATNWNDQALLFLEQGRARTLLDVITAGRDPDRIKSLMEETYERRERGIQALSKDDLVREEVDWNASLEGIEKSVRDDQSMIADILNSSAPGKDPNTLFESIPDDTFVLHISLSRQGFFLLCLNNKGVQEVYCGSESDIEIRKLVFRYLKLIKSCSGPSAALGSRYSPTVADDIRKLTARISGYFISPTSEIENLIIQHKNIIFVPSHSLQRFPCSAFLLRGKSIFLQKVIYQVPSLSALVHLQGKRKGQGDLKASILTSSKPAGRSVPLTGVQSLAIARAFSGTMLDTNTQTASIGDLNSIFNESDIVYISTHGYFNQKSPMESYIDLGRDKHFRVLDLARIRTNADLIVFNACFSGQGSTTGGNDVLGFSHAVLQAGAKSYIGSLWEVLDWVSLVIMVLFFNEIKAGTKASIAECWNKAQIALYSMDKDGVKAILEERLRDWDAAKAEGADLDGFKGARKALSMAIKDIQKSNIDFHFPTVWAPFVLVGNGSLSFCRP